MWLLLVAVGSGYLARCYQHVLREGSLRLAEIGQKRLLKARDGFQFQSLKAAAETTTQLAVVEPTESSAHHPPPTQFDPVSNPPESTEEEPHTLERHPSLEVYPPRDQSQDAISTAAAQIAGEQDSQYAGGMGEGEAASLAGACPSYPDEHLLHTIRPKRRKLFHRTQDLAPCTDSATVHAGSPEDVVHRREEALLTCGVGLGVLLASKSRTSEIQQLQQLLMEAEAQLEVIEWGSKRSIGNHVPAPESILKAGDEVEEPNQNSGVEFSAGIENGDIMEKEMKSVDECLQILAMEGASSSFHVEQMSELEAELEAELEQLTGQFSDAVDKDGVGAHAVVMPGDLSTKGSSAAQVKSDEDDDSAPQVPNMNNYTVSPRELTRLLHKLQESLQEERISKLEADLESVETQLQLKEEELEKWKKHVQFLLSELSLTSTPATLLGPQGITLNESMHGYTLAGAQEKFQRPVQQPSSSSGFSLLDSFLDAHSYQTYDGSTGSSLTASSRLFKSKLKPDSMLARHSEESTFFETHDQEGHLGVDRRLDFGDVLKSSMANDDEVCDEFLQAMVDGRAEPAWNEWHTQARLSTCKPSVFDDLKADHNLFAGVAEHLKPKTSNSGSTSSSISDFSDALSMLEDWASGSDSATTGQISHSIAVLLDASEIPDWITSALYGSQGEMTMSESEDLDGKPREVTNMTTLSSTEYTNPSIIKSVPGSNHQNPSTSCWNTDDGLNGQVGVSTPIEDHRHRSSKQPILSTGSRAKEQLEWRSVESSPRVGDQILFWDDLIRRGPATGMRGDCKWQQLECQSQASNSYYKQQQQQEGYQDSSNVESPQCCKESLVVTTDHEQKSSSGNLPFTTIADEKRKHESDIFPSEAHTMLIATRPQGNTASIEEGEEEANRVQICLQSRKTVKQVPNKLGTKDGIETEEEEYKSLQRQLQQLRM